MDYPLLIYLADSLTIVMLLQINSHSSIALSTDQTRTSLMVWPSSQCCLKTQCASQRPLFSRMMCWCQVRAKLANLSYPTSRSIRRGNHTRMLSTIWPVTTIQSRTTSTVSGLIADEST